MPSPEKVKETEKTDPETKDTIFKSDKDKHDKSEPEKEIAKEKTVLKNNSPPAKGAIEKMKTIKLDKKEGKTLGFHSEATQKFIYSDKFIQELILTEKNEIFRPPKIKPKINVILTSEIKEKALKRDIERQNARKKVIDVKKKG